MTVSAPHADRIHRCDKHPEKVQYRTLDQAFDTADRRSAAEGYRVRVYACDHCGFYHLSKKAGTENLGRELLSRSDGLIFSTATPARGIPVVRDREVADLATHRVEVDARARAELDAALAHLGHPVTLVSSDVARVLGRSNEYARKVLAGCGWVMTGTRRQALWHHPDHVPDSVGKLEQRRAQLHAARMDGHRAQISAAMGARESAIPEPAGGGTPPRMPSPAPALPTPAAVATVSGWETWKLTPEVSRIPVGDLLATLASLGIRAEIRIRR